MKKLLFAVSALAALSLLAPSTGFAQLVYFNQVGLYTTPDGLGETGTMQLGAPVDVFLVLTKPADASEVPYSGISAFDVQLNFNPTGGIFMTGNVLAADGFNIGDMGNIAGGYLEFIVGFAAEVPVVNDAILLVSLQFINSNVDPVEVTMSPASVPSIPGTLSYLPVNPPLVEMYPSSGSLDDPVFVFGGTATPVEKETFGSVKALFR